MKEDNKKNRLLVPVSSNGLVGLEKSIGVTEKILKEQNDRLFILSWDIIFEHKDFFNQFFSTFYSFSETQLIAFHGKLRVGSPYIDLLDDYYLNLKTEFGLIFNKNINWTEKLKMIYYEDPRLLWAGGSEDVYSYDMEFDKLPLDINQELEKIKSIYQDQIMNEFGYSEEEGYYDSLIKELDNLESNFNNILLGKDFSNEDIFKVITNNLKNYFGNEVFYETLINKIHRDINDFNIEGFYSKMNV